LRDAQILRGGVRGPEGSAKGPRFAGSFSVIDGVLNADAIPALERLAQFAGARHRLIANNIANLDTPGFRPMDLSVSDFQEQLAEVVEDRRAGRKPGPIELQPEPKGDNILFHDGNDRDLDRTMQDLVENFLTFRVANELLRSRFESINIAIRERV
jgi:flagellar basal-body rod protein FlgB